MIRCGDRLLEVVSGDQLATENHPPSALPLTDFLGCSRRPARAVQPWRNNVHRLLSLRLEPAKLRRETSLPLFAP